MPTKTLCVLRRHITRVEGTHWTLWCGVLYSGAAPSHHGSATGLNVPCAVYTMVQLFTIDSCCVFTRRWPLAMCGCPCGSHGVTMQRNGGLGP